MTTKIANPPLPPELKRRIVPCGTPGCDWPARFRRGQHSGCARHGPMATHCPTCGNVSRWFDLTHRPHCAACEPEPTLGEQIAQVIALVDADPRTTSHAATLRLLAETIAQADKRMALSEMARQQAAQDVDTVARQRQDAHTAWRRAIEGRDPTSGRREGDQQRLAAADTRLQETAIAAEEAGAVERDHRRAIRTTERQRAQAIQQVRQVAATVLQIQAKPAMESRASLLARVLGRG